MSRTARILILASIIGFISLFVGFGIYSSTRRPAAKPAGRFAASVDLSPIQGMPVMTDGRISTFQTHAEATMRQISGPRSLNGRCATFDYLDMLFQPERYAGHPAIYVKNRAFRRELDRIFNAIVPTSRSEALLRSIASLETDGRIAFAALDHPAVAAELNRLSADAIRFDESVRLLQRAAQLSDPLLLERRLAILPPQPNAEIGRAHV